MCQITIYPASILFSINLIDFFLCIRPFLGLFVSYSFPSLLFCGIRVSFNEWTLLLLGPAACLQLWMKLSDVFGMAPAFGLSFYQGGRRSRRRRRGANTLDLLDVDWWTADSLPYSAGKQKCFPNLLRLKSMKTKCWWRRRTGVTIDERLADRTGSESNPLLNFFLQFSVSLPFAVSDGLLVSVAHTVWSACTVQFSCWAMWQHQTAL